MKNIMIALHHFPISLLEWRKRNGVNSFAKFLSLSDLGNMGLNDNVLKKIKEESNSAFSFLKSHTDANTQAKYKKVYVQSPLETRSEVRSFLKSETRCNNSSSVIRSNITLLPATNTVKDATYDSPINQFTHQQDTTFPRYFELPTPTKLFISPPRIESELHTTSTSRSKSPSICK